jgi:DNA uptake protein ComE-like DNA-binding protein
MNKKHAVKFSTFAQNVILSTTLIFSVSAFAPAQAQQSVVDNPMLSSSSVRYGPYTSSTNRPIQIQSVTPSQTSSTKVKSASNAQKKSTTGTININSATETELVGLPGIGPSKARAIGPATLDKLRAYVTL